jgi:arylformamidase
MQPYYDISPEITPAIAVFPGDTEYARDMLVDFSQGDHFALSKITTTPHLGAHVDAPNHYHPEGVGISDRSLTYYFGLCQVVHVLVARNERITQEHLAGTQIKAPRVLFKTGTYPNPNHWNGDFAAFSAPLVDWLAKLGVRLLGIDTPSVDLADDKVLEAHQALYRHDMANLEGIVLDDVPPGLYHLTALPLRLRNADASPVRAVLWKQAP